MPPHFAMGNVAGCRLDGGRITTVTINQTNFNLDGNGAGTVITVGEAVLSTSTVATTKRCRHERD